MQPLEFFTYKPPIFTRKFAPDSMENYYNRLVHNQAAVQPKHHFE